MQFDSVEGWTRIYSGAGLTGLDTQTGPFEMMTPRGFLADEGLAHCLAIMSTVAGRPAYTLGYIIITGTKPE